MKNDGKNIERCSGHYRYDKGYIWSPIDPSFESLDSQVKHIPPYAVYYRQIDRDWYLYLENQSD